MSIIAEVSTCSWRIKDLPEAVVGYALYTKFTEPSAISRTHNRVSPSETPLTQPQIQDWPFPDQKLNRETCTCSEVGFHSSICTRRYKKGFSFRRTEWYYGNSIEINAWLVAKRRALLLYTRLLFVSTKYSKMKKLIMIANIARLWYIVKL